MPQSDDRERFVHGWNFWADTARWAEKRGCDHYDLQFLRQAALACAAIVIELDGGSSRVVDHAMIQKLLRHDRNNFLQKKITGHSAFGRKFLQFLSAGSAWPGQGYASFFPRVENREDSDD